MKKYSTAVHIEKSIFSQNILNSFIELGKPVTNFVRERISDLLNAENAELRDNEELKSKGLVKQSEAQMLLPIQIPNYTDFY